MPQTAPQAQITRLVEIMRRLRDPETGCPWDLEQTYATIAPYTIEEAYEVADAVAREAWDELPGELGDLLLQVVYFAQMADEDGRFDLVDVARAVSDKMVARHPHVFGAESRDRNVEQQTRAWESQKAAERARAGAGSVLAGVALGLPALTRALKLQKRAARVGFDWDETDEVVAKIAEEAAELAEARKGRDRGEIEREFGDLLFAAVNLGRRLGIDPEAALRAASAKFERRFTWIEARLTERGRSPAESDLVEMDALWQAAKAAEASD